MRAAVLPSALAVASLSVSVGCGTAQPSAQPAETEETSARFTDVIEWGEADGGDEVINGAFDWATGEGWSKSSYGDGPTGTLIQIGLDCFFRDGEEGWKHWRAEGDNEPFCSDEFQPPQELLAGLRSYWTLESEGEEEVRGAKTTHYRVEPKDEYADDPAWIDVWLGKEDVVYKLSRPLGEAAPRTREYFDFGVQVEVKRPCRPAAQKGELPPCEEDTG
jgi:hypothetical protein